MPLAATAHPVQIPDHGLHVIESHHAQDFRMPEGVWPFHKLGRIAAGRGTLVSGPQRIPLHPGELVHIPAHHPHRFEDAPAAPMTLVLVCYEDHLLGATEAGEALQTRFQALAPPASPQVFHMARHLQQRVQEDLRTLLVEQYLRKPGWEMATVSTFTQLIVTLTRMLPLRDRDNPHDLFQHSLAVLDEQFYRKISTGELADLCGVSERTYSGTFKSRMGCTVTEYLLSRRIFYAKERLRETGDIAYAALESGFSDLAHFYRMFKKHTNMSPGQFRATPITEEGRECRAKHRSRGLKPLRSHQNERPDP